MKKNKGKTLFLCLLIAVLLMPVRAAETENTTAPEETTETAAPAVPDPTLPPEETTEPEPIPIDYSDLSYRIAVANGLDPAEYTAESWSGLENAPARPGMRFTAVINPAWTGRQSSCGRPRRLW